MLKCRLAYLSRSNLFMYTEVANKLVNCKEGLVIRKQMKDPVKRYSVQEVDAPANRPRNVPHKKQNTEQCFLILAHDQILYDLTSIHLWHRIQWQIQDFSDGGGGIPKGVCNFKLLFGQFYRKSWTRRRNSGREGGVPCTPHRSVNDICLLYSSMLLTLSASTCSSISLSLSDGTYVCSCGRFLLPPPSRASWKSHAYRLQHDRKTRIF